MNDDIKNPIKISKKGITAIVVAVVLLAAIITTSIFVSVYKVKLYADIVYIFMDKEKRAEDETNRLYHIRKNANFDPKDKDATILDAFEIYFEDENGEMCYYSADDKFTYDGSDEATAGLVILIFITSGIAPLKKVGTAAAIIVPIVVVIGLIVLWYKLWSKKEDEERAKRIAKYNKKKK